MLLVFAETASEIPLDPVTMAGAMYGNLQVSFPVGEDSTEKPPAQMVSAAAAGSKLADGGDLAQWPS